MTNDEIEQLRAECGDLRFELDAAWAEVGRLREKKTDLERRYYAMKAEVERLRRIEAAAWGGDGAEVYPELRAALKAVQR